MPLKFKVCFRSLFSFLLRADVTQNEMSLSAWNMSKEAEVVSMDVNANGDGKDTNSLKRKISI